MYKNTKVGYKLFKVKKSEPGKLFPLYVNSDISTPMGVWIEAKSGDLLPSGKVKAKLGSGLAYRPGWHLNDDVPFISHIGKKDENGKISFLPEDLVWCEVEYPIDIDYQPIANEYGRNKEGKIIPSKAYLKEIPINGYYKYKTSPTMTGHWVIAGAIKVNRIISDKEVRELCEMNGYTSLPRFNGEFDCLKYGFAG